jgi:hypothetical protein
MEIEIEDFLIRKSEGINKFDLYRIGIAKKGKNIGAKTEAAEAYGISYERCIRIIIHELNMSGEDLVNMNEFLVRFEAISDKVLEKLK